MPFIHYWFHLLSSFSWAHYSNMAFNPPKLLWSRQSVTSGLLYAVVNSQSSPYLNCKQHWPTSQFTVPRCFIWLSGHDALPAFLLPHWIVLSELSALSIPKVQSSDCFLFLLIFIFLAIPSSLMAFNSICRQLPNFIFSSQTHRSNCILNISFS